MLIFKGVQLNMISNSLRESAYSGNLPKVHFSRQAFRSIRNDICLYDFCNWFNSELFTFTYSECRLLKNTKMVIGRNKSYAHDFGNDVSFGFLDFCQKVLGISYYSALYLGHEFLKEDIASSCSVDTLNTCSTTWDKLSKEIESGTYFVNSAIKQPFAYLCGTRGIDRVIVKDLFNNNLLFLRSFGKTYNLCFPFYENNEKEDNYDSIIGFEVIGSLSSVRYKSVVSCKPNAYFAYYEFYNSEEPCYIFAFESVIDLLSFASLVKNGLIDLQGLNVVLVSMRGLCKSTALKAQKDFKAIDIYYFVDTDESAEKFLSDNSLNASPSLFLKSFKGIKDWNDIVCSPYHLSQFKPITISNIVSFFDIEYEDISVPSLPCDNLDEDFDLPF